MKISTKTVRLEYVLSIAFFVSGLSIALSWSYYSRLAGVFLILFSIVIAYKCYTKTRTVGNDKFSINKEHALLGLFLILIDLVFNISLADSFKSFDYGVIVAGTFIILLNIGLLRFLKLDRKVILFITYFLFITLILYGFLFSGLPLILGNKQYNPLFNFITKSVVMIAAHILNFIKPTTFNGNLIDFSGLNIWVGDPCSGAESISVFYSSVVAYMIAIGAKDINQILKYLLIGTIILYLVNILRVLIIVLFGYYMGTETMLFIHHHIGWIFFVASMSLIRYFIFNDLGSMYPFQKQI
jgi:archaeosortase C (PEF-CTERM variant)